MRGHRAAVAVVCLVGLQACQRDYRFNTHARYESLVAHLDITIEASGLVLAGADLSEASTAAVRISPIPPAPGTAVDLTIVLPDQLSFQVKGGPRGVGSWPPRAAAGLAELLQQLGYGALPPDELAEVERAIMGALAGPKATLMDGQTRTLRVLETSFR
jgi:hypothetical protein